MNQDLDVSERKLAKVDDVFEDALKRFDTVQTATMETRQQCVEDRRFYSISGAQWDNAVAESYGSRPMFEVNKVHLSVIRIINEYRNNRISVSFLSKDGLDKTRFADTLSGLYRSDEQDSVANEAYDNAFEEATSGGIGAWRLRTVYEDEEDPKNERQRIRIDPIFDADTSVFFDLESKRQDKADAKFCFVVSSMDIDAYREAFDDDPVTWPKDMYQTTFDWHQQDIVYVAEYYRVEEKKEKVFVYRSAEPDERGEFLEEIYTEDDFKSDPMLAAMLAATNMVLDREKKIKKKRVRKYIMSGNGILEDCGYIAGRHIPIVVTYGKRWYVDNIERCMGHVRLAKDAQRLKNLQLSKLAEYSALSAMEKPIFFPEQMQGHQNMWSNDNKDQYPYLMINPVKDANGNIVAAGPVGFTKSSNLPPAMATLLQVTEVDMQDILGNPAQAEKMVSNISGEAVDMIQQRLDMQTFIYMSNHAKGMRRCGEIWLSMAKDIYVEEGRKMKTLTEDKKVGSVELMRPVIDPESAKVVYENDFTTAEFDVAVDVGPSSSSKRAATVRALTSLLAISDDPETKQVLQAMSMLNMEGEGIEDVRNYFRQKMVRAGVIKPTDEEKEQMMAEMQNMPPDPNTILVEAMAKEAEAKAGKAQAETMETMAAAELKKAQTMKTMSDIGKDISQDGMPTMQNNAMQQENKTEMENEDEDEDKNLERKNKELELESKQLENDLKRAKIESLSKDQNKEIQNSILEANQSLIMASQMLEKLSGESKEKPENDAVSQNIAAISEAIAKIGDAINAFSEASIKNTKEALSMVSKPKRIVRENGKISRIETDE